MVLSALCQRKAVGGEPQLWGTRHLEESEELLLSGQLGSEGRPQHHRLGIELGLVVKFRGPGNVSWLVTVSQLVCL